MERQGAGRPQGWEGSRLEVRDLIIGEAESSLGLKVEGSRLEVRDLIIGEAREQVDLKVGRGVGWKLGT